MLAARTARPHAGALGAFVACVVARHFEYAAFFPPSCTDWHWQDNRVRSAQLRLRFPHTCSRQAMRTWFKPVALRSRRQALFASTESDFDCWERARVDDAADFGGANPVRTVFGYGSLIFRPGFPYVRAYPACVRGFIRRFWQRSCDHRGTPSAPGRVVTLVRYDENLPGATADEAIVHGVAYEVDESMWGQVLEELDIRERHGYIRTVTQLFAPDAEASCAGAGDEEAPTPLGQSVVYYAYKPHESAAFAGTEPVDATASIIATSRGPSGPNDAYLFSLEAALQEWSLPPDPYIAELAAAVRSRQSELAAQNGATSTEEPS